MVVVEIRDLVEVVGTRSPGGVTICSGVSKSKIKGRVPVRSGSLGPDIWCRPDRGHQGPESDQGRCLVGGVGNSSPIVDTWVGGPVGDTYIRGPVGSRLGRGTLGSVVRTGSQVLSTLGPVECVGIRGPGRVVVHS